MYGIVSNGELVGLCDKVRYVKIKETSGAYIECEKEEAAGISVRGNLFNIDGKEIIKDAPMAIIREMDGFEILFQDSKQIGEQQKQIDDVNDTAITGLMATTDLYEELIDKGVL